MKNRKKLLITLLATSLFLLTAIANRQTNFIRRAADDILYDNRNHYLSCEQLPSTRDVMQVVENHQDVIQKIEQVNPGSAGVEIDTFSCAGRADIVFWYGGHQDRLAIEKVINGETFFDVPYRLHNR